MIARYNGRRQGTVAGCNGDSSRLWAQLPTDMRKVERRCLMHIIPPGATCAPPCCRACGLLLRFVPADGGAHLPQRALQRRDGRAFLLRLPRSGAVLPAGGAGAVRVA